MDAVTEYCFKTISVENFECNDMCDDCVREDIDNDFYSPDGPWMKKFIVPSSASNISRITNETVSKSMLTSSSNTFTADTVADCNSKGDSNDMEKNEHPGTVIKTSEITNANSNKAKSILQDISSCSSSADTRLPRPLASCSSTNSLIFSQGKNIETNFTKDIGILWCRIDEKTDINITVDNAIRVRSEYGFAISVSGSGDKVAFIHPCGKVRCLDGKLQAVLKHPIRFANINDKEITVAKEGDGVGLVIRNGSHAEYKDSYIEISNSIIDDTFLTYSKHGSDYEKECQNILKSSRILRGVNGGKYFRFGGIEVANKTDTKIEVTNKESKMILELLMEKGIGYLRTSNLMISFGIKKQAPFYIKFIHAVIHFSDEEFIASYNDYSVTLN